MKTFRRNKYNLLSDVERIKQLKEQKEAEVLSLYLKCFNTVEIAEKLGISDETVRLIIKNQEIADMQKIGFEPELYNIWNSHKDNQTTHFGNVPASFTENLLQNSNKFINKQIMEV